MKLLELYPLTVVALRSWPNPRGKAHSGIDQVSVKGPNDKVKLKAGKRKRPLFNKPLVEGWRKHPSDGHYDSYSADMSEVTAHQAGTQQNVRCPKCRDPLDLQQLTRHVDGEGDATHWAGHCPRCGSELTVWND